MKPWVSLVAGLGVLSGAACSVPAPLATRDSAVFQAKAAASDRYQVTNTIPGQNWERIERLTSTVPQFPTEQYLPSGRQSDPDMIKAFGSDMPSSKDVLLHYYRGWDKGSGTPVLLVHGTVVDATSAWISPHGQSGLAPYLASKGARVFAVTFANRQGNNLAQAEQIADAVARIRAVTGASKVDVVSHSKGTVAARTLASGLTAPYLGPYRHDIRRLVLIAGPNAGMDMTYRHALINYGLYPQHDDPKFNAPMAWDKMLFLGVWVDTHRFTMLSGTSGLFAGQAQLLAKWDKEYPLPAYEQDWYTTYYGGQGFVSTSAGIDAAIAAGGHFIDNLRAHPLDPTVELAVLSGDTPNLPGIMDENTGPSDGIVFVKSATATDDMVRNGAKLVAKSTFHFNHMDLIIAPQAHSWVGGALTNP